MEDSGSSNSSVVIQQSLTPEEASEEGSGRCKLAVNLMTLPVVALA